MEVVQFMVSRGLDRQLQPWHSLLTAWWTTVLLYWNFRNLLCRVLVLLLYSYTTCLKPSGVLMLTVPVGACIDGCGWQLFACRNLGIMLPVPDVVMNLLRGSFTW